MPVDRLARADSVERALWLEVTRRAADLRVQMMKAQASHIAQQVSLLFRRG